jgi:hypothetical protein
MEGRHVSLDFYDLLIEAIGAAVETTNGKALNRKINGWANYFCLGPVSLSSIPSRGAT